MEAGSIPGVQHLQPAEVGPWVEEVLLNVGRLKPVVAVTTQPGGGPPWIDPRKLDEAIGAQADVVLLETGDATWELADALPPRLDAYGGAVRVWWPGLTPDAHPYDHPLLFIKSPGDAAAVFDKIVTQVRSFDAERSTPAPVVEARVTAVDAHHIELAANDSTGPLRYADVPLADLARCLSVGTSLPARVVRNGGDGRPEFSVQGLLPTPWELIAAGLEVGHVILARVQNAVVFGAFVDVLPGAVGLVHKSEVDWTFVHDVNEFVSRGQVVAVKILRLDPEDRRMELSIKQVMGATPRDLPSLVPGGKPFAWEDSSPRAPSVAESDGTKEQSAHVADELEALARDRATLAEQNKQLREQNQALRKELRGTQDRLDLVERRAGSESDTLSNPRAFVRSVRIAYARMYEEDDRLRSPLLRMRVGPEFLDSLRELEGAELDKVVEVCAQVACDRAHENTSREVHQLHAGRAGKPRVRESDNAQAWRCALQVKSPSARRLHWWRLGGASGATIEFASVGVHDEFDIPS